MSTNSSPKIFCIGSNLESFHCLEFLVQHKCRIDTLITLPSGHNKNVSDYYDLHDFCNHHEINIIDTINVNSAETITEIKRQEPDYLFTLGWSQIFKEDFINCFSKFIIGTHPSKLPHGRGRAPLPWTIIEGLGESAVSFFKIDNGVDTGQLIFQRKFTIPGEVYVKEVYDLVSQELAEGFYALYQQIANKKAIKFEDQDNSNVTVRGKRVPSDGLIEFDKGIHDMEKLIRAVSAPYPGAYCYYKDQKIIFWTVAFDAEKSHFGTLGQILKKSTTGILVQFQDGNLWLNQPTYDNGDPIELKFFRLGDKLGYNVQDQLYYLRKQLLR